MFELVDKHRIACEVERNGTLHCAVGRAGSPSSKERERQWRARGAPVRLLDKAEAAAKIGAKAYAGALLDERAGTIQPLAYARGLAARGDRGGRARLLVEPGRRLPTPTASAGSCARRAARRGRNGSSSPPTPIPSRPGPNCGRELTHLPYFNFATAPLDEAARRAILPERQGCWDTRQVLSSFRFDQAGRLVFGSVGALRGTGLPIHRAWARRALAKLFPRLAGVEFEARMVRHDRHDGRRPAALPSPRAQRRLVQRLQRPRHRAGTVFGRCLADLALGAVGEADLPLPVSEPKTARLRHAAEAFYEVGAQAAHFVYARV